MSTQKRQSALFSAEETGFDRFWAVYPKRVAKKAAQKAWAQLNPTQEQVEKILDALAWQALEPGWADNGGRYVPYPATWLRAERWNDERVKKVDARGHFPPCRTNTECNRKLEQEIAQRKGVSL